jgi:lysophospholipase L1-like esterase
MSQAGRSLAGAVSALLLGLAGAGCSSRVADQPSPPVRILLVGDSVTQGSSGDWTWRYRLWQHLVEAGVRADLVGPDDDLLDPATRERGSHEYADPDFDQDHAARWGMSFLDQDHPIGELVDDYHPDVVVEMLGINDLAWRHATAAEVEEEARRFVRDAQAADPDLDVVVGALPQSWVPGVGEYDAALPALAAELATDASDVVVAAAPEPFVQGVDTYDSAHPAASGEVAIAASVADALAGLGIGTPYPRPLPAVPNGPREQATLTAVPADGSAMLSWQLPPGADSAYVWVRDATVGQPWTRQPDPVRVTTATVAGLVAGHTYELRLQAARGTAVAQDVYSVVVPVTIPVPPPPAPAPAL